MTMSRVDILLLYALLWQFQLPLFLSVCLRRFGFWEFLILSPWSDLSYASSLFIYNEYAYPQHSPSVEPSLSVLCGYVSMGLTQVRFHPLHPEILASGSLDHEVRLWDTNTAECTNYRDFCNFFCMPYIIFRMWQHSSACLLNSPCWLLHLLHVTSRSSYCLYCFPCPRGTSCCCFRSQGKTCLG